MIQLKKKLASAAPSVLKEKGKNQSDIFKEKFDKSEREFSFDSGIYGDSTVKEELVRLQDDKCCFCEAKITHISYGDVEHFRPKAGWVQDNEPLNKPGYYWLAYDWENLFLSCQICNQRYKKNYFPLADNSKRAKSHKDNIDAEEPLFIHPAKENPEKFIAFKDEVPVTVNNDPRGDRTIKELGIDREKLNDRRRERLNLIRTIYNLAKGYPDTNPDLKKAAWEEVKVYFDSTQKEETEYASMLRCFFRENPLPESI